MKPATLNDMDNLAKLPVGEWFAAGAYSIHHSKVARLYRLGYLKRRVSVGFCRTWDYYRPR